MDERIRSSSSTTRMRPLISAQLNQICVGQMEPPIMP